MNHFKTERILARATAAAEKFNGTVLGTQSEHEYLKFVTRSRSENTDSYDGGLAVHRQENAVGGVETVTESCKAAGSKRRRESCEHALQGAKLSWGTECCNAHSPKVSEAKSCVLLPPPPSARYFPPEAIPCTFLLPPAASSGLMNSFS